MNRMTHAPARIDDAVLEDLRERIARTRLVPLPGGVGWERGTDTDWLADLLRAWAQDYDWRQHEPRLLDLPWHVTANGTRLVHQRAADDGAVAVVLLHGWPDSALRFTKVLPLLTDLHVVVPCLPGYPWGRATELPGTSISVMADEIADSVAELGYERYVVSGGDVGSAVAESLAAAHPDAVAALHLTDVPYPRLIAVDPTGLSDEERQYLRDRQTWQLQEGAYVQEQRTKPHTLAAGLGDSPAGLAAWIVEKLRSWSDCGGDVESRWTRDELLTWLTLYWVTGTIGTSFGSYVERPRPVTEPVRPPTAFTVFPHDLKPAPRVLAEQFFDVRSWDERSSGGHFGAWEEPEAFVEGVRAAVRLAR